ncbi:MAG: hypothetical protein WCL21_00925 [Mariniphaga sp.]
MKILLFILFFISLNSSLSGQTNVTLYKGSITYISAQNVYVKFENTEGIHIGDTLFISQNNVLIPVLTVSNLSSVSCVALPIGKYSLSVSTSIFGKKIATKPADETITKESKEAVSVNDQAMKATVQKDINVKPRTDGRLALSSYSNKSNSISDQRYRYNFSLNAEHISNSNFSTETYLSLTHKSNELNQIGKDINKYLKIYSLALKYDLSKTTNISFGRKINMNMANIGAVDGLQFETGNRNFTFGAIAGSRPDYFNYSFNPNLMQFGVFAGHNIQSDNGNMQTSLAIFDQTNKFKTDRRFAYLQHSNSLLKKLDLFCSFEFDFYTLVKMQPTTNFDLTSTYVSLRYKPWKKLSLFASYDARKNIYYYETFKNQIDSIIDRESRQGFRFQLNYHPIKYISWGASAGYRFQKSDPTPSINGNSYLSYNQIPLILTSLTINATLLKSNYVDGMVYGASLSRDIFSGKVYTELEYRLVNYTYKNSHISLRQDIAALSLSWRIAKKLTFSSNFEYTHEPDNDFQRLYISLTQRF